MNIAVRAAAREGGYFPKVINYEYVITTGPRCPGLVSNKKYKTNLKAYEAAERMVKKLTNKE